jgi:hypothetical protein
VGVILLVGHRPFLPSAVVIEKPVAVHLAPRLEDHDVVKQAVVPLQGVKFRPARRRLRTGNHAVCVLDGLALRVLIAVFRIGHKPVIFRVGSGPARHFDRPVVGRQPRKAKMPNVGHCEGLHAGELKLAFTRDSAFEVFADRLVKVLRVIPHKRRLLINALRTLRVAHPEK